MMSVEEARSYALLPQHSCFFALDFFFGGQQAQAQQQFFCGE
jgi:hypothetical protein